jgi:hypothetical protein
MERQERVERKIETLISQSLERRKTIRSKKKFVV